MTPQQHRLLSRIHRRYQTVSHAIDAGGITFQFVRIADPDRVLDEVAAAEDLRERLQGERRDGDQLHLPYWAELWDSASGVGQHLVKRRRDSLAGADVLDLGCGMGLAGTVAAALDAHVLFADLESPALLFARLNSLAYAARVRTRRLNWQRDRLDEKFDLIVGADILYERKQWDFLESFWRAHLLEGASIILGEPGRQTGDLFVEWIRERGWALEQFEERVPTRERPIRLFELRLG